MQVTITLNHLLILILCGFLLAVILYGLQIFKNISKELSITAAKISHYQSRLAKIEEQMESFAVNVQDIKKAATGKTRHCMNISECLTEIKKLLAS